MERITTARRDAAIRSGKIVALGTSGAKRTSAASVVPTIAESGAK